MRVNHSEQCQVHDNINKCQLLLLLLLSLSLLSLCVISSAS